MIDHERLFEKGSPTFFTASIDLPDFDALVDELGEHADDRDADVIRLRGAKCRTASDFFTEVGAVLTLPHYFGENWDALNDVMYSLSWMPGTLIMISDAHLLLADAGERDLAHFVDLADKCNRFYLEPPYDEGSANYTGFHVLANAPEQERGPLEQRLTAAGGEFSPV